MFQTFSLYRKQIFGTIIQTLLALRGRRGVSWAPDLSEVIGIVLNPELQQWRSWLSHRARFFSVKAQSKYPVLFWFLIARDFCFLAIWAAGPVHKKKLEAAYEQLLRAVFSWVKKKLTFFWITLSSELKSCIINLNFFDFFF